MTGSIFFHCKKAGSKSNVRCAINVITIFKGCNVKSIDPLVNVIKIVTITFLF